MAFLSKEIKIGMFVLLIFCCSCFYNKEYKYNKEINSTFLKIDFKILRQTLEEAHPGLYWYSDKPVMDHYFDSICSSLDHDMTRIAFFKTLLPLIAKIKCVHTNLHLPKDSNDSYFKFSNFLPFNFFCTKDKIYITNDYSKTGHAGAEVLSINNNPSEKIIKTLLNSLPADGYNETYKYHLLNKGAFREGYALYFDQSDAFVIETIDSGNIKPGVFTVKAKSPQDMPAIKNNLSPQPVYFNFQNDLNTVVLTINTFEINTKKFTATISTLFKTIKEKNIQHLIIDLRENGGGNNNNIPELFSFIATKPFLHLKRAEMNAGKFTYLQYFNNPQDFKNLHGIIEANGKLLMNYRYAGTSYKNPDKDFLFTREVIILTSGHTTSAASEFAAIARYKRKLTIIGEEAGGCYYGATGGNYINLILPNSKLEARIPTIKIFTAVTEDLAHQPKGRGTIPDYELVSGINDILQGKDVQLERAFSFIRDKKGMHSNK